VRQTSSSVYDVFDMYGIRVRWGELRRYVRVYASAPREISLKVRFYQTFLSSGALWKFISGRKISSVSRRILIGRKSLTRDYFN
jgi:hypothetical protein